MDRRSRAGRVADRSHDRLVRGRGRQARRGLPADEAASVISLERRNGRPAADRAPRRAALAPGEHARLVSRCSRDGCRPRRVRRLAGRDGELVVAHWLGEIRPETPTLDEALALLRGRGARDRRPPRPQAVRSRARGGRRAASVRPRSRGASSAPSTFGHSRRIAGLARAALRHHRSARIFRHLGRRARRADRAFGAATAALR